MYLLTIISGHYAFIEASNPRKPGDKADLVSEIFTAGQVSSIGMYCTGQQYRDVHIFNFWTQYGQNTLDTPITIYKTDLPTLPIFGQRLRVFPYQIHIRSSHFGWQV